SAATRAFFSAASRAFFSAASARASFSSASARAVSASARAFSASARASDSPRNFNLMTNGFGCLTACLATGASFFFNPRLAPASASALSLPAEALVTRRPGAERRDESEKSSSAMLRSGRGREETRERRNQVFL
ncbi:hypothetical protein Tsubulata_031865, partial [Turnera subulata]